MPKLLKIALAALAALLLLIVLVVGAFALLFDPNDFRAQITDAAKKATGRELTLGQIKLSVWPVLGANVKDISLGNAPGFGATPLAQVAQADVGLALLPLLTRREAQVKRITLSGLALNLASNAAGKNNWDGVLPTAEKGSAGATKPAQSAEPAAAESDFDIKAIAVAGLSIKDARITYSDQRSKQTTAITGLNLETGRLTPGSPADVKLTFATQLAKPALAAKVSLETRLQYDAAKQTVQADKLLLSVKTSSPDLRGDIDMQAGMTLSLASKIVRLAGIAGKLNAEGKAVPGGKQAASFKGDVLLDSAKGTLKLSGGELAAGGLNITLALDGTGLSGAGQPRFTGPLAVAAFNPRELLKTWGTTVETADAEVLKSMSLRGSLDATASSVRLAKVDMKLDQTSFTGSLGLANLATQALEFALQADSLDADRYLPKPDVAPAAPGTPAAPEPAAAAGAPIAALHALDGRTANGSLSIGQFKISNLRMSNAQIRVASAKGGPQQINLAAQLYGGSLAGQTRITPGAVPTIAQTLKLTSIAAGPLLTDYSGKAPLTGNGNVNVDVVSSGNSVQALKQSLSGNVAFSFENGAIKGFNLGQALRKAQALLKGQQFSDNEPAQTDFTELSANAVITNGVLRSEALNAKSPLFRVDGAGQVNLVSRAIDYTARPTVVNTASGQGGKDLADLTGVVIPIRITGTLDAPKYAIDLKAALQQKAAEGIKNKLTEQLGRKLGIAPSAPNAPTAPGSAPAAPTSNKDKLKEGLKGLFSR